MKEKEFEHNMMGAEAFHNTAQEPKVSDFWSGYIRGIRRHFHGKKFGTDDEHARWMAYAKSDYDSRRARGIGYRKGFSGESVRNAAVKAEILSVN